MNAIFFKQMAPHNVRKIDKCLFIIFLAALRSVATNPITNYRGKWLARDSNFIRVNAEIKFHFFTIKSPGKRSIMASASSSSAKNLFYDSKRRISDRVIGNVNNTASVGRQIVKGSRSTDVSIHHIIWHASINLFFSYMLPFIDLVTNCKAIRSTGKYNGKHSSKFEENGAAATAYGISVWLHHWKHTENRFSQRAGPCNGKINFVHFLFINYPSI